MVKEFYNKFKIIESYKYLTIKLYNKFPLYRNKVIIDFIIILKNN